ncbi:MAG: DUF4325 domain-containing protein [Burkholderiales bacterium]|nr:DUF4325 domain-containing protein [Burkholderiales bacterium]
MTRRLSKLVEEGWLLSSGSTRAVYKLANKCFIGKVYSLEGELDESICFTQNFRPYFAPFLPDNVMRIFEHGFTEMLNNAIDHSEGKRVFIGASLSEDQLRVRLGDDGVGVFGKIVESLNLPDKRLALLELSKGKFTSDPSKHSGQGIFFTSRMFDHFVIIANDLQYDHEEKKIDVLAETCNDSASVFLGTRVDMVISRKSKRIAAEVFQEYSDDPCEDLFTKTIVPVRLASIGGENLISRSQGKRLYTRFERFEIVILDFAGVDEIGQAFADEVFRVFVQAHPNVSISTRNTNDAIDRMIRRARAGM